MGPPKQAARTPGEESGQRYLDVRALHADVTASAAFDAIQQIGGRDGWYFANWLWGMRGFIDRLLGGPGMRTGRRDPLRLTPGDVVDFWRVEAVEPNRLVRLSAEMKLPGRAWLEFEVESKDIGSVIRQRAVFDSIGLGGRLYWYAMFPVHLLVFSGLLRAIVARAHRIQGVFGRLSRDREHR